MYRRLQRRRSQDRESSPVMICRKYSANGFPLQVLLESLSSAEVLSLEVQFLAQLTVVVKL